MAARDQVTFAWSGRLWCSASDDTMIAVTQFEDDDDDDDDADKDGLWVQSEKGARRRW